MTTVEAKRRVSDWFRQWRDPLRRFLLGRVGVRAADVEDVGQEVFLRLLRYEKAELIEHPQAYLYKIASNVAAEWSIRAARGSLHQARWLDTLPEGEQPEDLLLRTQANVEVKRTLSMLSPRQREVLRLYFNEELGHAQIAERMGESLRTAEITVPGAWAFRPSSGNERAGIGAMGGGSLPPPSTRLSWHEHHHQNPVNSPGRRRPDRRRPEFQP